MAGASQPLRGLKRVRRHPGLRPAKASAAARRKSPPPHFIREQWIKEGDGAIKWTRLSCRSFAANAVRLQLHVLAYNIGNFMRTLAMPKAAEPGSLTSLREKADQDRRQDRQPWPLRHLPIGRGRGVAADVPGNLDADRPTAGTAGARVSVLGSQYDGQRQERYALTKAKQPVRCREEGNPRFRSPGHPFMGRRLLLRRPKSETMVVNGTGIRGMSAKEA